MMTNSGVRSLSSLERSALIVLCIALTVATFTYWGRGLSFLTLAAADPTDLHQRWVDQRYILAGRNPYDVFFVTPKAAFARRPMWNYRDAQPLPHVPAPTTGGYPPWAFFLGIFLYFPPWPAVRIYFAAVNVAAGAFMFAFGFRLGLGHGRLPAIALALCCTGLGAASTTLGLGQYGIVIVAMLMASLWLLQGNHRLWAGVALGLAATKPTISALFGLPFLAQRQWTAIGGLAIYLLIADTAIWLLTKTNPIEMTLQMLRAGAGQPYMQVGYGPMNLLMSAGLPQSVALPLTAATFGLTAAIVTWLWAKSPSLNQYAIAAVAGRLWTYHQLYDNLMLVFLLLALGDLALRTGSKLHWFGFVAVGISLWAPGRWCDFVAFQNFQMLIWIAGLAVLLAATYPTKRRTWGTI